MIQFQGGGSTPMHPQHPGHRRVHHNVHHPAKPAAPKKPTHAHHVKRVQHHKTPAGHKSAGRNVPVTVSDVLEQMALALPAPIQ